MHGLGKVLLFSLLLCLGPIVHGSEIIHGQKASKNSMQYMVSVQDHKGHLCGGFLISQDYVVTAAHCADNGIEPDRVILGTHDLESRRRKQIRIADHCKHPEYWQFTLGNDIMLLKLAENVREGNGIRTIPLPPAVVNLKKNETCTVAGWGITETESDVVDELRVVNVSIINPQICRKEWRNKLPPNVICAGGLDTKNGFCLGDSGGPLVCNGRAVGVVSFNNNCKYPGVPNVYTDISRYLPWINKTIKENQCFN